MLNRIGGQNASQILGTLQSNGIVYLINPNGILFGQGSVIDVAGLVASSLNMSDANFLANRLVFDGGSLGGVSNLGSIAFPWAQVRSINYQCANLTLVGDAGFESVLQQASTASATGEGLSEVLDVELIGADFFGL